MITPVVSRKTLDAAPLTDQEREAVARLRARVHEILAPGQLRSLILYGSKARGDSRPLSDIDVLLVYYDALSQEQHQALLDLPFGEGLNPQPDTFFSILLKSQADIVEMESYGEPILQNIQREGIVIEGEPIRVKQIDKNRLVASALEQARDSLTAAELMFGNRLYRKSVAEAYYVFLHGMRAALLANDVAPQSHPGTNCMFALHFVRAGLVDAKFNNVFGTMLKNREDAEYEYRIEISRADAERAVARAQEFLAVIEGLIPSLLQPGD